MTEFGVDYNWEHRGPPGAEEETPFISCVSLGCYCGVALSLNSMGLRDAAFPFDWNRTSMEGVIHFLRTGFRDFFQFSEVRCFPESKSSGGKMFRGEHHSIWHEDCTTVEGTTKYERRICRLLQNSARKLLFIRCLNSNIEVIEGKRLLDVLKSLFPLSDVYVLLIADCQPRDDTFFIKGTEGRLIVHCVHQGRLGTVDYGAGYPVYNYAIAFAYECAIRDEVEADFHKFDRVRTCTELLSILAPFFGGAPQHIPFSPSTLPAPCLPLGYDLMPTGDDVAATAPTRGSTWPSHAREPGSILRHGPARNTQHTRPPPGDDLNATAPRSSPATASIRRSPEGEPQAPPADWQLDPASGADWDPGQQENGTLQR
mmetsp:Transcript_102841/g.187759  ORF Transcript_102841/g.187759 Transcript_102841/m.187759 type:complete len:371 (-) Transcript_102841:171-1283(-)